MEPPLPAANSRFVFLHFTHKLFGHKLFWPQSIDDAATFFRPHSAGTSRSLLIPDADPIPFLRQEEVANLLGHSTEFYDGSHAVEFCTVFLMVFLTN